MDRHLRLSRCEAWSGVLDSVSRSRLNREVSVIVYYQRHHRPHSCTFEKDLSIAFANPELLRAADIDIASRKWCADASVSLPGSRSILLNPSLGGFGVSYVLRAGRTAVRHTASRTVERQGHLIEHRLRERASPQIGEGVQLQARMSTLVQYCAKVVPLIC